MKLTFHPKVKQAAMSALLFACALVVSFPVLSQQTVTGKVSDNDGKPLAGASVTVKTDPARGTMTNDQGAFSIIVSKGEVLLISMVGYEASEFGIGDQDLSNLTLALKPTVLGEVVTIAYGSARRKDAAGAISTISRKNFENRSGITPAELMQGQAAGVQIVRRSGTPGIQVHVMIRGTGSFTSIEPLYVIDGIRSEATIFNSIHPEDIENITVLKDAASTAIYGADGANGVVIITTKRGRPGPPAISVSTQWGIVTPPKKYQLLTAAQYLDLAKEYQNPFPSNFRGTATDGADWQNEVFRNALVSSNHVSISGGSEKVTYNISAGYFDQESALMDFRMRSANLRVSLQETAGIFQFGQNINFQYQHQTGTNDYGHYNGTIRDALGMPPYLTVRDAQGDFTAPNDDDLLTEDSPIFNPLARMNAQDNVARYFVLNPQFFGEVRILKSLKFRSQISLKYNAHNFSFFQNSYNTGFEYEPTEAEEEHFTAVGYLLENYATWNQAYGKHNFTVTAGNGYINKGRSSLLVAEADGFPNNSVPNISVALSPGVHEATVSYANPSEISYFGRLIYSFDNKFILSASIRRDGSSIFGEDNKFGNFPGLGFAWNAGREKFMEKIKGISDLRFRATWGKTGNSNAEPFQNSQSLYSGYHAGTLIASLGPDEGFLYGMSIDRFPNPLLKWEETTETNIGMDLGLFDNKLRITADWYNRTNRDLLIEVPIPNSTGTGTPGSGASILSNAASVVNKGIELQLIYSKTVNPYFNYSVSLNGAYNKNKVISIGSEFFGEIFGGYLDDGLATTITRPGDPIGAFYGWRVDRVNPATGYFDFKDTNGDGNVDESDKEILGSPIPKFVYGGNIQAGYKNFDISILLSGAAGVQVYNDMKYTLEASPTLHNVSTKFLNHWKRPGDNAQYPGAALPNSGEINYEPSDFFIENGSFLRVKALTIGYSVPEPALKRMTKNVVKNLRFYISSENLLTLTPYSGYDPEVSRINGDIIFSRGLDLGQVPQTRSFLGGMQISF